MAVKVLKLLLGFLVGGLLLFLAFRNVAHADEQTGISWTDILDVIRGLTWWGVAGFSALYLAQFLLRTERWRLQVRGLTGKMPGRRESLAINAVAMAAVFLLPFRLGELVRPNLSAQRQIMRASAGLAATALERVMDGIVTTGFFGIVLVLMHARGMNVPDEVAVGGWLALGVFGGAIVFFLVAFRWRTWTTKIVERVLGLVHGGLARKVSAMLLGFLDGLACFRAPRDVVSYVALTAAYWILNGVSMWLLMRGMGIDADWLAAYFCLCFLVIGMMVPAPPGNVGNFHAFAITALRVFAVRPAATVAYAIVLHALTVVGCVVWAAAWFVSGDLSLDKVRAATRREEGPVSPSDRPS